MALALVFNPGSNSLKFELIELSENQQIASDAKKLASAALDDIGRNTKLQVFDGRATVSEEPRVAKDMSSAVHTALEWLEQHKELGSRLKQLRFVGVRVVHGGRLFDGAVRFDPGVREAIESLEDLAPLHNKNSIDLLDVLVERLPDTWLFVTFDTAFHATLPEKVWRYPIERKTADRYGVRKFGFHGLSHRYMLDSYSKIAAKPKSEISIVTLHLESGCSACAISRGESFDTTMGMTPLEGLMMGSRSGSVDPAIVPYLVRKEQKTADEILKMLNKQSGLIGVAGGSLDTRVLRERKDDEARLALAMFSYRVRLAVGAYLAALGDAEAVIFGGGIGEDSPWLREEVCAGLRRWGLEIDGKVNARSTEGLARLSTDNSHLQAWVIPPEEGLQIAHECMVASERSL
jgi:acetate kinase